MPDKKDKKSKPTKQEWDTIIEALIPDAEDLDNEQIAEKLRGWMRTFPKSI